MNLRLMCVGKHKRGKYVNVRQGEKKIKIVCTFFIQTDEFRSQFCPQ